MGIDRGRSDGDFIEVHPHPREFTQLTRAREFTQLTSLAALGSTAETKGLAAEHCALATHSGALRRGRGLGRHLEAMAGAWVQVLVLCGALEGALAQTGSAAQAACQAAGPLPPQCAPCEGFCSGT